MCSGFKNANPNCFFRTPSLRESPPLIPSTRWSSLLSYKTFGRIFVSWRASSGSENISSALRHWHSDRYATFGCFFDYEALVKLYEREVQASITRL